MDRLERLRVLKENISELKLELSTATLEKVLEYLIRDEEVLRTHPDMTPEEYMYTHGEYEVNPPLLLLNDAIDSVMADVLGQINRAVSRLML